jgi:hypothetical protein
MTEEVKNAAEEKTAETKTAAANGGPIPAPGAAPSAPDLNISDLNAVKSIIDIATQRGAFRANELEAVGKTYNKLNAFLDHVTKTQQEKQTQGQE